MGIHPEPDSNQTGYGSEHIWKVEKIPAIYFVVLFVIVISITDI